MSKLRKVLLIASALVALGASVASSAAATEFHFESETALISGAQQGISKYTMTAGELTCETSSYTGVATKSTQTSIRLAGVVSGCHLMIFGTTIAATVNQNGCEGIVFANSEGELVCPEGKNVVVTAPGCTITIPPQKHSGGEITNTGNHIHMSGTVSGIKYSHSGFTCGSGSGTNGTISGQTTVTATDTAKKEVKVWVE
jgi:hypothetical protein